jgi:Dockerin type I domain
MALPRPWLSKSLFCLVIFLPLAAARSATVWNESTSGDLSNNQSAPSAVTLATGTNSVIGTVGGGDLQDWLRVTIPAGFELSTLVLHSYQSSDTQGFTGVQAGNAFVGDPENDPTSYLGYAHFGTGATNGSLSATNLVGADLLPIMGNKTLAFGSKGFTPPLASGNYVFLIQQLGASTSYQFDFNLAQAFLPGDFNQDNHVNAADIPVMLTALIDLKAYQTAKGLTAANLLTVADVNKSGTVTNADVQALLTTLKGGGGSLSAVPEPATAVLGCVGILLVCVSRRSIVGRSSVKIR